MHAVARRFPINSSAIAALWMMATISCGVACSAHRQSEGESGAPNAAAAKKAETKTQSAKLPGLTINFEGRAVDLDAMVCLDTGGLEFVACTKGTKEHESIVSIDAKPRLLHAALLLIGAKPGNPGGRIQVGDEEKRWVDVAPAGERVQVFLVVNDKNGKPAEKPISHFVRPNRGDDVEGLGGGEDLEAKRAFPDTFLFTGSRIFTSKEMNAGKPQYLADLSGHVISISTFGDETLGMSSLESHQNGALAWQVDGKKLPEVGTKVLLRLKLKPIKDEKATEQKP